MQGARAPTPPRWPSPGQDTYLGQVHGHVQVVVQKVCILLGVQQLKQRRRGVALVAPADLVHLKGAGVGRGSGPCPAPAPAHQTPQWETDPGVGAGEDRSRRKSRGASRTMRLWQGRRPPGQGRQCQETAWEQQGHPVTLAPWKPQGPCFHLEHRLRISGPPGVGARKAQGPRPASGRGVRPARPAPSPTHLVYQDQGVLRLGLLQTLDDLAWHGTHVRPPGEEGRVGRWVPSTWASHTSA